MNTITHNLNTHPSSFTLPTRRRARTRQYPPRTNHRHRSHCPRCHAAIGHALRTCAPGRSPLPRLVLGLRGPVYSCSPSLGAPSLDLLLPLRGDGLCPPWQMVTWPPSFHTSSWESWVQPRLGWAWEAAFLTSSQVIPWHCQPGDPVRTAPPETASWSPISLIAAFLLV